MNKINIEYRNLINIEKQTLLYLKEFKSSQGLYVIKPKSNKLLSKICAKLKYNYTSDVAYVGKASLTKNSSLYHRSKQEMGWSNFEAATFVRKIGLYLNLDITNKRNKLLQEITKNFICLHFEIILIKVQLGKDLLQAETDLIEDLKPCLNVKKNYHK